MTMPSFSLLSIPTYHSYIILYPMLKLCLQHYWWIGHLALAWVFSGMGGSVCEIYLWLSLVVIKFILILNWGSPCTFSPSGVIKYSRNHFPHYNSLVSLWNHLSCSTFTFHLADLNTTNCWKFFFECPLVYSTLSISFLKYFVLSWSCKCNGPRIGKTVSKKKNKVGGVTLPNFET